MQAATCATCGGWLDARGACPKCGTPGPGGVGVAPISMPMAYEPGPFDRAPDGRVPGLWPAWGLALLSLACNPVFLMTFMAIGRAREELAIARALEADGDTARADSLRVQAWVAIGIASFVPVVGCVCVGAAVMLNVVGAAAGGSGH